MDWNYGWWPGTFQGWAFRVIRSKNVGPASQRLPHPGTQKGWCGYLPPDTGIFRVRKADLEAQANGTLEVAPTVAYGRADGMQSTYCNGEARPPAGWKTRDGKLWFPTIRGIVVIDPDRLESDERPPRVLVESVVVGSSPIALAQPVKTASVAGRLEIRYTPSN